MNKPFFYVDDIWHMIKNPKLTAVKSAKFKQNWQFSESLFP